MEELNTTLEIPMTKKVITFVENGVMKFERINDTYYLEYHNNLYTGSPFKLPMQFSTEFKIYEILSSPEVINFMKRFN
jgi:hypothetical protein